MRALLLSATLVALLLAPTPARAESKEMDCIEAEVLMAKSMKVIVLTAEKTGVVDPKTLRTYEQASNKYFACQKRNQWSAAVAPSPQIAQTQGQAPPQK